MTLLTVSADISPATVENKPATELVVGGAPDPSIIAYAQSSVRGWCGRFYGSALDFTMRRTAA